MRRQPPPPPPPAPAPTYPIGRRLIVNDMQGDAFEGVLVSYNHEALVLGRSGKSPVRLLQPSAGGDPVPTEIGGLVTVPVSQIKFVQEPD